MSTIFDDFHKNLDSRVKTLEDGGGSGGKAGSIQYITEAPTKDNTEGGLILVVLTEEPAIRYEGYLYLITPIEE